MPIMSDIIADIRVRYPNPFTDTNLVYWTNEILRKVWKYMNTTVMSTFVTIANQPTYTLPTDCIVDQILTIEIATDSTAQSYQQYNFRGLLDDTVDTSYYYDGLNGVFGIYPVPETSGLDARIFYNKRFTLINVADLTVTPEIDADYHDLITHYVCMTAAQSGNNPDVGMANNFAFSFNDSWLRMFKNITEKKIKDHKKKRCNPWWG